MNGVNWEEQWQLHAPGFQDGLLRVPLKKFNGSDIELLLKAGGGFGDLSHPTTRLALKLLLPLVQGRAVVDIGCGSGILTLAALASGATSALSVDIEPDAIAHTRKNAELNGFAPIVQFPMQVTALPQDPLIVMNMISSEQEAAWQSLPTAHLPCQLITSGVLASDQDHALALYKEWGFSVIKTSTEEGWCAYLLQRP